jgi:YVTN family beta-propeller protein
MTVSVEHDQSRPILRSTGVVLVAVGVLALAGTFSVAPERAAASPSTGTHWGIVSSIPVDNIGTIAINESTNTVYSADFVPQSGTTPDISKLIVIDGATNTKSGEVDNLGLAPANGTIAINESTDTLYVPNFGSSSISVIDGATNTITNTITRTNSMPWGAVADQATNTVYVTDGNDNLWLPQGQIYVVDGATNAITSAVPIDNTAESPAIDPAENEIFVPMQANNYILVLNTQTNSVVTGIYASGLAEPSAIAIDPVLHRAYVTNDGTNSVSIIDTATNAGIGSPIPLPTGTGLLRDIAVDPINHLVYVAGTTAANGPGEVWVLNGTTGAIVDSVSIPGEGADNIAFNPQTQTMYVGSFGGNSSLIDVLKQIPDPPTPPTPPAPTPSASAVPAAELADTGQDVAIVPAILGVAILAAGGVLLAVANSRTRRRRRAHR